MTFQEFKDLLTKPIGAPQESGVEKPVSKKRAAVPSDIVGIELGSGDPRGCPAVRLLHKKGQWVIKAIGFVPSPEGKLPSSWKELDQQPTWSLPSAFAAGAAALAVNSPDQVIRQTTKETLTEGGKKLLLDEPNSRDGLRFTVGTMGDASSLMESGLPEYQVLWLSRLLPEGHRPTAFSVQTAPAAMLAALAENPEFNQLGGNAAALFVTAESVYFVGYRAGLPVLFREFAGLGGILKMREALKAGFGMEEKMVDEVLDDTLIDPSPILSPIINPILRQLELSLDYLKSRLGVGVDKVFLMGLSSGAKHWGRMCEEILNVKLVAPELFEGLEVAERFDEKAAAYLKRSHRFMMAYGAARAAMEEA